MLYVNSLAPVAIHRTWAKQIELCLCALKDTRSQTILYYANKIIDDVINCSKMVPKHKMTNVSANNRAIHAKLGNSDVVLEIHRMVQNLKCHFTCLLFGAQRVLRSLRESLKGS